VAEGETPSLTFMGSRYKEKLEREWDKKSLADVRVKTLQIRADKNISRICRGELIARRRRHK